MSTKRKYEEIENTEPFVYHVQRGKPPRYEIRSPSVSVKGIIKYASLVKPKYGSFSVSFETQNIDIKKLCDEALSLAFHDARVLPRIKRTNASEFITGAKHSILKDYLTLKRKYRSNGVKDNQPSFFHNGKRIFPKTIMPGSIVEVKFELRSFDFNGQYGLTGLLDKEIVIHKLCEWKPREIAPVVPYEF